MIYGIFRIIFFVLLIILLKVIMPEDTPKIDLVLPEKKKRGRPRKNPDVTASAAKEKVESVKEKSEKDVADEKVEKVVEAEESQVKVEESEVKKSSGKKVNKGRKNNIAKNNDS